MNKYEFDKAYDGLTKWRESEESLASIVTLTYSDSMADQVRENVDNIEDPVVKEAVGKTLLIVSGMLGGLIRKGGGISSTAMCNIGSLVGHNLMSEARGEPKGVSKYNQDGTERTEPGFEKGYDPSAN